ncbi:MAG: hypothetical protein U0905_16495 [Pirellulales bacterium]
MPPSKKATTTSRRGRGKPKNLKLAFGAILFGIGMMVLAFFMPRIWDESKPKTTIEDAKLLLINVLDDWKNGIEFEDLARRSPPILISDDLWRNQNKLQSYKLESEGEYSGKRVRFKAKLQLTTPDGNFTQMPVKYLVTTQPQSTIVREGK